MNGYKYLLSAFLASTLVSCAFAQQPDWVLVNPQAAFQARDSCAEVAFRGKLWLLGGWFNLADVWYSADGKHWQKLKTPTIWKSRHEHSTYVHQDKLWVVSGHAKPLSQEVWSLSLPPNWGKQ